MKSCIRCAANVPENLRGRGFCRITPAEYIIPPGLVPALEALTDQCRDLPLDPRARNGERRRRHGRYLLLPWMDVLVFRPVTTYYQDAAVNTEDGGVSREFAGLTPAMQRNEFLHELIRFDFAQLPLTSAELTQPWDVGCHFIEMCARCGRPGLASPDRPHKDGEPFTYIHLLRRENITGGASAIYANAEVNGKLVPGKLLFEDTLDGMMDTLLAKDDAVFHQVKRIDVIDGLDAGSRLVLLIDFSPMVPKPNEYPNLG